MSSPYTAETIGTMIAIPIIILVLVGVGVLCFVGSRRIKDRDDRIILRVLTGVLAFSVVATIVGTWWGMYPWKADYHEWRAVGGTVTRVDSRLIAGDHSTNQKFVVTFEGNPQQYGVDDTRAAGIKVGDRLDIACVRRWQQSGTDGYDCNFVSMQQKS